MVRQFYYKNGKDVTEHFSYEGCIVMCIESLLKQEPTRLMVEALEQSVYIFFLIQYCKNYWKHARRSICSTERCWNIH